MNNGNEYLKKNFGYSTFTENIESNQLRMLVTMIAITTLDKQYVSAFVSLSKQRQPKAGTTVENVINLT